MDDVILVTVCQSSCGLQGNTTKLVEVTVQVVVGQRSALQIFHQFVVAVLTVDVGLAVVGDAYYHLQVEILDNSHQGLLDGEVRIVNLQHHLAFIAFYEKYLRLTRIVAEALDTAVYPTLQHEIC